MNEACTLVMFVSPTSCNLYLLIASEKTHAWAATLSPEHFVISWVFFYYGPEAPYSPIFIFQVSKQSYCMRALELSLSKTPRVPSPGHVDLECNDLVMGYSVRHQPRCLLEIKPAKGVMPSVNR